MWAWEEEGWGRLDIGGADWVGAESRGSLCKAETQCTPPVCSPLHITCWESHSPAPTPELFFPVKVSCSVVFYSCVTPWPAARQARLSMGFSRQEYWRGLPFPSSGDLPDPRIEPRSPALQADPLPSEPLGLHYND